MATRRTKKPPDAEGRTIPWRRRVPLPVAAASDRLLELEERPRTVGATRIDRPVTDAESERMVEGNTVVIVVTAGGSLVGYLSDIC
jgi:hypothetical protein